MVVTINTDASFNPDYKVGAYAYWIVYNNIRIKRSGLLKNCDSSIEAEIKAIANALHQVTVFNWTDVFFIIINTDCIPAIKIINREHESKVQGTIQAVNGIHRYLQELKIKCKVLKSDKEYVRYRHVKAHNGTPDKRSYVNDWCDTEAKKIISLYKNKHHEKGND